jgi:CRISPR-associated protein Csx17
MPTLSLAGCAPTPLAHYLKALGILRLVAEQADPAAAGCWRRDNFVLHTTLDAESLTAFFLERYAPTPVLAPWNGGSGFYFQEEKLKEIDPATGKKKKTGRRTQPTAATKVVASIATSTEPRLALYREAISCAQNILAKRGYEEAPDAGYFKDSLIAELRASWPDVLVEWIDCVALLVSDQDSPLGCSASYPPLLGTGANDGNTDFTSNFMQRVSEVLLAQDGTTSREQKRILIRASLFAESGPGQATKAAIGQFAPGSAGGANGTSGFNSASAINPWDFIFMIEGALAFAAAAVKRLESIDDGRLAYPFCVRQAGIGYASASTADEATSATRGEMWMPLWEKPATYSEISALFSEGRAQVGSRSARNGVDFIRAVVTLGVDRGIISFQRFGFQVRNGLAYFATPLERVIVRQHTRANLLIEIDRWLDQLRRFSGDAPASISRALRGIETAIDDLCRHDDAPHFRALLVALGRAEQALARSFRWTTEKRLHPLKELTADWLKYASDRHDTDRELRLAAALASAHGGALRSHLEPVEGRGYWKWDAVPGNDVCWTEGGLQTVLLDILTRRLSAPEKAPLLHHGHAAFHASLDDIEAFIRDELDDALIADLWWALSALDWRNAARAERPFADTPPSALFSLLRLCFPQPGELRRGSTAVPPVPAIVAKARAGLSVEASKLAVRRLRASGFRPRLDSIEFGTAVTTRTAAALLFPLHPDDFSRLQTTILNQVTATQA